MQIAGFRSLREALAKNASNDFNDSNARRSIKDQVDFSDAARTAVRLKEMLASDGARVRDALSSLSKDLRRNAEITGDLSKAQLAEIAETLSRAVEAGKFTGELKASEKNREIIDEAKFGQTIAGRLKLAKKQADEEKANQIFEQKMAVQKAQAAYIDEKNQLMKEAGEKVVVKRLEVVRATTKQNNDIAATKLENFIADANKKVFARAAEQEVIGKKVLAQQADTLEAVNDAAVLREERLQESNQAVEKRRAIMEESNKRVDERKAMLADAKNPAKSGEAKMAELLKEEKFAVGLRGEQLRQKGKVVLAQQDDVRAKSKEVAKLRDEDRDAFKEKIKIQNEKAAEEKLDKIREMKKEADKKVIEKIEQKELDAEKAVEKIEDAEKAAEKKVENRREQLREARDAAAEKRLDRLRIPSAYRKMLQARREEAEKQVLDMIREQLMGTR